MEGASVYDSTVGKYSPFKGLSVERHTVDIDGIRRRTVDGDHKSLPGGEIIGDTVEYRGCDLIFRSAGTQRMETGSGKYIPRRHLTDILVAAKPVYSVAVGIAADMVGPFLSQFGCPKSVE